MATKKAAAKEVPLPTPVAKMTKTQTVKVLAEKLEADGKQVQAFLDALLEMATEQTREAGEFTIRTLAAIQQQAKRSRLLPRLR